MNCRAFLERVVVELGEIAYSLNQRRKRGMVVVPWARRVISGAVLPTSRAQVQTIVKASRELGVPLIPYQHR